MRAALWVVLAATLASSSALAQGATPLSPPPPPPLEGEREDAALTPPVPALPLPGAGTRPAPASSGPPSIAGSSLALRLLSETGGGLLGELSLGLLGGYLGYMLDPGQGGLFPRLIGTVTS